MSTRSIIGIATPDGHWPVAYVYCHYDGYPSHTGRMLQEHFNDPDRVQELLAKGDFSRLESSINDIDYYQDHGEANTGPTSGLLWDMRASGWKSKAEYMYLYAEDGWAMYALRREISVKVGESGAYYYPRVPDKLSAVLDACAGPSP